MNKIYITKVLDDYHNHTSEMLQVLQKSNANNLRAPATKLAQHLVNQYSSSSNPQSLPYLPVPKLNDTLEKYLKTVQPHLPPEKFSKTQATVKKFAEKGGIGERLQSLLEQRAEKKENWLSDWWLESAYLKYRDPVVVFSSPGLVFPKRKFTSENDRLKFTAKAISAALSYKNMIDNNKIPVESVGKFQLDMEQYKKIFGTCRIPGLPGDRLVFHPNSKHIVVIVNNMFFKVPVYGNDGKLLSESQLLEQLEICLKEGNDHRHQKVGILTSDMRDNWATSYQELVKNETNRNTLEAIQSSLFTVSIDREFPQIKDDHITGSYQLITGGGSRFNSGNRWYDKTIQLIVGSTGINGFTYEHSPAEGQPIAVLTDYLIGYVDQNKNENSEDCAGFEKATALKFKTCEKVDRAIQTAAENVDKLQSDLDMECLHFKDYGKNFIKTQKFSPDSYIQMALQYAFYRLYQVPGAHYESAQTRMFVGGRTETIRSCSNESIAFAKAMCDSKMSDEERLQSLKDAINSHKKYVNMAIQGLGVDRHLLGLKLIANENNIPLPELYQDEGYLKSAHMRLSTSQVASRYEAFMCYGPLVKNGYGACYSPRNEDMLFGISSFYSCPETSSANFKKTLEESLRSMQELLLKVGEPIKAKL